MYVSMEQCSSSDLCEVVRVIIESPLVSQCSAQGRHLFLFHLKGRLPSSLDTAQMENETDGVNGESAG